MTDNSWIGDDWTKNIGLCDNLINIIFNQWSNRHLNMVASASIVVRINITDGDPIVVLLIMTVRGPIVGFSNMTANV